MLVLATHFLDSALIQSSLTELLALTVMLVLKLTLANLVFVLEATLSAALSSHLATSLVFALPSMEHVLILALQE
jgi:hypothetical protein